ncbi:MAG: acyl-CoA synthetase [Candidatus Dormibacteria bacterium]
MEILTAARSEQQQRRAAGAMAELGLRPGNRIVFLLPGSPELLSAVLGSLRTGLVPVMLDPSLTPGERRQLLDDASPSLVVDTRSALASLLSGEAAELSDVPLGRPMHYTSGTTGRRKGVWSGMLTQADATALLAEERQLWDFRASDRHLVVSPLHHSAPLRFATGTLLAGGEVAVLERFTAEAALSALTQVRPSSLFCTPAHLQRLFEAVDAGAPMPDLSSIRLLAHAGAPCPIPLKERMLAAFPSGSVWEFYGSTEGQFTVCSPADWATHPGSVGRARHGRQLFLEPDGTIWCRVPPHARFTYWRDPDKTARAWRGDAFTVGDLGRLDGDGYLYLDGRREDLLISGGVNVYPLEVEIVLATCPGVTDVAVFGRPDERWGQRICAVYAGDASDLEVRAFAAERLSPAKRPKEYHRVGALPRSTSGKVARLALPARLGLGGGAG